MIVDSSVLIAIIFQERGWTRLRDAIYDSGMAAIPAPVLTETRLVIAGRRPEHLAAIESLLTALETYGVEVIAFDQHHADITAIARDRYGRGNGTGGTLNFGDLMVYAIAKQRGEPLLCTGRDFATTDLVIHPASRLDP